MFLKNKGELSSPEGSGITSKDYCWHIQPTKECRGMNSINEKSSKSTIIENGWETTVLTLTTEWIELTYDWICKTYTNKMNPSTSAGNHLHSNRKKKHQNDIVSIEERKRKNMKRGFYMKARGWGKVSVTTVNKWIGLENFTSTYSPQTSTHLDRPPFQLLDPLKQVILTMIPTIFVAASTTSFDQDLYSKRFDLRQKVDVLGSLSTPILCMWEDFELHFHEFLLSDCTWVSR